ncbi:MAG TPA: DUF502 domain-containing protein [Dehalococcoidales bacterium]|nr:DUF502 domain-containing protein [Dehalococcoidales bacterium]
MAEKGDRVSGGGAGRKLRRQFITGILISIPLGASIIILIWVFNTVDNLLQPLITYIWGHNIPGVGFGVTVVLIYLVGVIASNILGKRLIRYGESLIGRVPIFRQLYSTIKHIVDSFSAPEKTSFLQVVLVEFPRKGMRAIGFVTNEFTDKSGQKLVNVLIPNSPNPMSGFMEIVKEEEVVRTKISVDQALQMIVSAGRMTPDGVNDAVAVE